MTAISGRPRTPPPIPARPEPSPRLGRQTRRRAEAVGAGWASGCAGAGSKPFGANGRLQSTCEAEAPSSRPVRGSDGLYRPERTSGTQDAFRRPERPHRPAEAPFRAVNATRNAGTPPRTVLERANPRSVLSKTLRGTGPRGDVPDRPAEPSSPATRGLADGVPANVGLITSVACETPPRPGDLSIFAP
jgi:hypothetical protein